jgi:hypothetical protein
MQREKKLSARFTILILCAATGQAFAQEDSPPAGPMPAARSPGLRVPAGIEPRATAGETLLLTTSPGKSQVVRSYCELGDYHLVVLPTGALSVVKQTATQRTSEKFVPATPSEIEAGLKSAGLTNYKFVDAKPYLFAYSCSEAFYLNTRSILESMLEGVLAELREWGLKAADPSLPLVVIIMPGRAEFDAYRPIPPGIVAYYDVLKNHVVLYEDQKLWEAAPEFAAKQASYTIAHESIHQLLANAGIERRLSHWPVWITEGLPEYFCPLKFNSTLVRKGASEMPSRTIRWGKPGMVNDLRMYELLRMRGGSGEAMKSLVQANSLESEGYALAWGLVHYLANEHRKEFQAYLKDISQFKPLDKANVQLAGRPDPIFVKHFGEDFKALERGVQAHLTSRKMQAEYKDPVVNQTHYLVRRVQQRGRAFEIELVITTSPGAARKWKESQEKHFKGARFLTQICKTRREAEFQLANLQQQ